MSARRILLNQASEASVNSPFNEVVPEWKEKKTWNRWLLTPEALSEPEPKTKV